MQGGPVALRLAKQAISLGVELDLSSAMQLEEACYAQVGGWVGGSIGCT
jgi:methylglutaconyl-CoA hydratase